MTRLWLILEHHEVIQGRADLLLARWYETENTPAAQTPIVDELEKMDRANPQSVFLTMLTYNLSTEASPPELSKRMISVVTDVMNNPTAVLLKNKLASQEAMLDRTAG